MGVERWVSEDHPDSACFEQIIPRTVVLTGAGDPMIAGQARCDFSEKGFVQCLDGETGAALWRFRGTTPDWFWSPFGGLASDGAGGAYFVIDLDFGPWAIGATRLDASGAPAWDEMVFDTLESLHATTAAGAPNRLYIAGSVNTHGTYVTALSAAGVELWDHEYDFAPGQDERATASATDPAGNLAVLVQGAPGSPMTSNYEVLKLNSAGMTLWHETYDAMGGADIAAGIACGSDGSVYVTGKSFGGAATGDDLLTIKFGPAGGPPLWVARVAGVGSGADEGRAIEFASGSVFVTGGIYQGVTRGSDAITLRYTVNGQEVWRELYSGPVGNDTGVDLATLPGRIVVTGSSEGADGLGSDFFTVMYSHSPVAVPLPDAVPVASGILASPNPSSGPCSFRFNGDAGQRAKIRLHDLNGHLVRRLFDDGVVSGERVLHWDGENEGGQPVPNGVYFASIVLPGGGTSSQRITIVR
jgi:outer membrane protein assembly factor BamB